MFFTLTSDTHFGFNHKTEHHHIKMIRKIKASMDAVGSKILVHAGDWASDKQKHFKRAMHLFREGLGEDIHILGVRGNHDFWNSDSEVSTWLELLDAHEEWFKEFNIQHLSKPFILDDVIFVGYDGWYWKRDAPTNDRKYMLPYREGLPSFDYLVSDSYRDLTKALDVDTSLFRKVVGVTHMPLEGHEYGGNSGWMPELVQKCDVICFGHSHKRVEGKEHEKALGTCREYNAGSDYGNIRFINVEI